MLAKLKLIHFWLPPRETCLPLPVINAKTNYFIVQILNLNVKICTFAKLILFRFYVLLSWLFVVADLMPEFGRKFGDVSSSVGETVKVAVQFEGKPRRVQWYHNGLEIDQGGRYQVPS